MKVDETSVSGKTAAEATEPSALMRSLTIVLPCLNEEANISRTVNEMLPVARRSLDSFEMIIINDGSTDRTGSISDELARSNPEISVIHYPECRGLAEGFRDAVRRAKCNYITHICGDGVFNINGIEKVFEAVGEAPWIIACRSNQREARSLFRFIVSKTFIMVAKALLRVDVPDIHGFGVFPAKELRSIVITAEKNAMLIEIITKFYRMGLPFKAVPITMNPEDHVFGRSILSVGTFTSILPMLFRLAVSRR